MSPPLVAFPHGSPVAWPAPVRVRPARPGDRAAIEAALAPEIAAGHVLPRLVDPVAFLVAVRGERIVGTVALDAIEGGVVELGALVAVEKGEGIGRRLVEAALERARRAGFHTVVALTSSPGFFEAAAGFVPMPVAPWAVARENAAPEGPAASAIRRKARTCAGCARLAGCAQVLLGRPLHAWRMTA